MPATIKIDGQTFEIEDEIAKDDDLIRRALTPFYPGASNSTISRVMENDRLVIEVTKKAGSKGSDAFNRLVALPESANPTIVLALALQERRLQGETITNKDLLLIYPHLEEVMERGGDEAYWIRTVQRNLTERCPACASDLIPFGF